MKGYHALVAGSLDVLVWSIPAPGSCYHLQKSEMKIYTKNIKRSFCVSEKQIYFDTLENFFFLNPPSLTCLIMP